MNYKKKIKIITLFFFFLNVTFLIPIGKARPTQIIYPLGDTFIADGVYSSMNFGSYDYYRILDGDNKSNALLYFELPSNYAEYHNVVFSFYTLLLGGIGSDITSYNVSIYNIKESWNETIVTWDTRPSQSELLLTTTIFEGEQSIDFKKIIPSYNFSFYIIANSSQPGYVEIKSKEYTRIYLSSVIILSDLPDPTLPGYEILIILGISSMVIIVIIKKYRMHQSIS